MIAQIKKFQNRFWTISRKAGLYRFTSAYGGKKKIGNEFSIHFAFGKSNFKISDRTLFFDFKNSWKILADFKASAKSAEASKNQNLIFRTRLRFLDKVRTFFEENPDSDFWTSAPLSALKFWRNFSPKTEKFSQHFFWILRAPVFFQKGKENFLFWSSENSERRKAELRK